MSEQAILLKIRFKQKAFQFSSFNNWCDKARRKFAGCGIPKHRLICVDTKGRICVQGSDFRRAEDEGCYPISVYEV